MYARQNVAYLFQEPLVHVELNTRTIDEFLAELVKLPRGRSLACDPYIWCS